jgi:preprotein translocase subunit SecD
MNEEGEVLEPQVETEAETVNQEVEVDATALLEQLEKEKEARRQLTARAKEAEAKAKALESRLGSTGSAPLAVEDYIDISASLNGLDAREQAFLAEQHKLSGKPLKDIRSGEDFQLWQSAYRQKQEAENALKPTSTQAIEEGPKSLTDRLRNATIAEKEAILKEAGLYKEFRPRADRTKIGNQSY